eukprot:COSAG01_NODE_19985_length_978_cov_1.046644_1_plen_33_part_10
MYTALKALSVLDARPIYATVQTECKRALNLERH